MSVYLPGLLVLLICAQKLPSACTTAVPSTAPVAVSRRTETVPGPKPEPASMNVSLIPAEAIGLFGQPF